MAGTTIGAEAATCKNGEMPGPSEARSPVNGVTSEKSIEPCRAHSVFVSPGPDPTGQRRQRRNLLLPLCATVGEKSLSRDSWQSVSFKW